MGFMTKLFGDKKDEAVPVIECRHVALTPRWDSVEDIGHEDRATSFVCEGCSESFTPAEATSLREAAFARLRN